MTSRFLAAASAALLLTGVATGASAKPAATFLKEAIQGDNSEVEMGRLAQQRAADGRVRDFGRMLEQDHSAHRQQAVDLARRLGAPTPTGIKPEARANRDRLRRLHGRSFDREFVRVMIDDHRKDIHAYELQAAGRGPDARLARDTLPVLRHHLQTAHDLRG